MSLAFDNPVQPVLAMPPDLAVWEQCKFLAGPAVQWRIYLHRIAAAALQSWFQDEFDASVRFWSTADPSQVWQVLEGLALTLGQRRIVVMLTETIATTLLQVPQEWVDIPGWVPDYYIAAQANVDEQRLTLWGYATYAQVKAQGVYDPSDRTYCLSDADLIHDFSAFWVAQQLEQPQAAAIPELPCLSESQAGQLIERLAGVAEPRLNIPFEQWGRLLSNARWRQQLWQRRRGIIPVDLSRWANNWVEPGWRSLESLLPRTPALGFRSLTTSNGGISRGKPLGLHESSDDLVLALKVELGDGDRSIRVQLFPSAADVLPNGVILALELSESGERLQTVQAGEYDNYIQLPSFRCSPGQRFRVIVQLGDAIIHEEFIS